MKKRLPFWQYMTPETFRVAADHGSTPRGALLQKAIVDGTTYRRDSFPAAYRAFKKLDPEVTAVMLCGADGKLSAVCLTDGGPARFIVSRDAMVIVRSNDADTRADWIDVAASNEAAFQRIKSIVDTFPTVSTRGGGATVISVLAKSPRGCEATRICRESSIFERGNYNPDVAATLDRIAVELASKTPSGRFALIEGEPGGGKTRAVRAILAGFKNKVRVIVVPSHMIADLSGPNLIAALRDEEQSNRPTVIVLEDADFALLSRENATDFEREGSTSALASLLNLSDGIIGGALDLRIVATTNAKIEHIDPAILRPGRLIGRASISRLTRGHAAGVVARETGVEVAEAIIYVSKSGAADAEVARWWRLHGDNFGSDGWLEGVGPTLAEAYETARRMREELAKP